MLFVQLDVNWVDHPKVMDVGLDGAGLHAMALCLAKRLETDGILDRRHLQRLGASDQLIDLLVEADLFDWIDDDRVQVHGWLDRNPSQDAIDATRTAKAVIGREGNHRRWGHPGPVAKCPKCNPSDPGKKPRSSQGAIPSDPGPSRSPIRSEVAIDIDIDRDRVETEQREQPLARSEPSASLALVPTNGSSPSATGRPDVQAVFDAWRDSTGKHKAKLDAKRRRRITNALSTYPLEDVLDAVRGWRNSPHHRGENNRGTVYNSLDLLLRDAERIEHFRDLERDGPTRSRQQPRGFDGIRAAFADLEIGGAS